jgi:hypothetical protein
LSLAEFGRGELGFTSSNVRSELGNLHRSSFGHLVIERSLVDCIGARGVGSSMVFEEGPLGLDLAKLLRVILPRMSEGEGRKEREQESRFEEHVDGVV